MKREHTLHAQANQAHPVASLDLATGMVGGLEIDLLAHMPAFLVMHENACFLYIACADNPHQL